MNQSNNFLEETRELTTVTNSIKYDFKNKTCSESLENYATSKFRPPEKFKIAHLFLCHLFVKQGSVLAS